MDSNNGSPPPQGGDPSMEAGDWRSQLQSDSRQRIVNKIMDTLKRHLPFSSQVGLHELEKVAVRFEEKIYTAATSQSDYLRKISLKMLTMETKSQNTMANSLQTDSAGNSYRPPEPGFMDSNNESHPPPPPQGGDPSIEAGNWRSKLASDMRQQLINKIMATLNGHPPFSGQEGLDELKKTAARFEEEFYAAATSQSDYVQKISQKMLTFVNKPQKTMVNSLESNGAGNSNGLLNPGSSGMQPQVTNQGQSVSMPLPANQSQTRQQFVPRNIQNNILPSGVQSSAGLSSALSPTVHYHLYYLQPPASGQNMSGLSSPQGLNMSGLSSALPLASTMSRLSSAPPPALFPTGALTAQQNMMNPSQPISSMFPGQGNAPKNLLQQVHVGSIQQTPVSAPQQAYMNALSSQNGINMLQGNINPLQSNSGALTAQQNMMNPSQPISSMVPGQGNAPKNLLQQVHVGSIQQTPVSAPQQAYMNALSSQNGINMLQGNINPLQSNSGILHNQHLKQQQQQVYQNQQQQQVYQNQLKQQYQQQQMQQQLMQKQQIIQLQQQQLVRVQRQQQWPGQSLTHQMPQLHQISVVNDVSKNASSSPSGSTMLQASIDSLKSNSGIVDNQHLRQEQEQKMFQNQLKLPYQQLQMQKPQILQDKQQQQIKQLQQQAKQQLHHIYFIYLIFLTILLGAAFFGIGY